MKGHCLCGKTQFTVEMLNYDVHVCHCSMCRRQSSGIMMTIDIVPNSLAFQNDSTLSIYDSSEWGERGFCKKCGTSLFWRMKNNEYCNVNVFALDVAIEDLYLDSEIYIDHKPEFYAFKNHTKHMTEAEVVALFSQSGNE
ncbi:GFA family protein [Acinetobacter stercoris]|uniref:Glutathione-dependent formaldehyde-activating enzyme n=1 Tax=Acinetobacter stercoris TaxID=2126983 RepID=A0A2U3N281_9GAMM|nr:GFA family protein [Acinetobacter stercoris]SPL71797.1 glutathione-dependent formaldehyde-activating enzyme [Acinetobacter stercoris]